MKITKLMSALSLKMLFGFLLLLILIAGLGCNTGSSAEQLNNLQIEVKELKQELSLLRILMTEKSQVGRWQITQHPEFLRDVYLLDTVTGRIWREYEDSKTKKLFWRESRVEGRQ